MKKNSYNLKKIRSTNTANLACSIISSIITLAVIVCCLLLVANPWSENSIFLGISGLPIGKVFTPIIGAIIILIFSIVFISLYSNYVKKIRANNKLSSNLKYNKNILGMWIGSLLSCLLILTILVLVILLYSKTDDIKKEMKNLKILCIGIIAFSVFCLSFSIVTIVYTVKNNKLLKKQ